MSEDRGPRVVRQAHAPGEPRPAAAFAGLAALAALTTVTAAATAATATATATTASTTASPTTTTLISRCARPDGRIEYTDGECAPGERARALPIELRSVDPQEQQEALRRAREDYERVTRRLDARATEHARLAEQRRESARRDAPAFASQATLSPDWPAVAVYGVPAHGVPLHGGSVYGAPVYGAPVYGVPVFGPPGYRLPGGGARARPYIGAYPAMGAGSPSPVQPGSGVGAVTPMPPPPTRGSYKPG